MSQPVSLHRTSSLMAALLLLSVSPIACGPSQEEYDAALAHGQELESQLRDAQASREQLEERFNALQSQNEEMANRLRALGENVEQLEGERTHLQSSLTETQRALEELRERERQAQARLSTFRNLIERFRSMIESGRLRVRIVRNRMVVELPEGVLFDSGRAELKDAGRSGQSGHVHRGSVVYGTTEVVAGTNFSYVLTITNNGGFDASSGFLTNLLPEGARFASATASQGSCKHANGIVSCALGTLMGGGGSYTVTIVASIATAGTQTNTAIIQSVNPEASQSDNVSTYTLNAEANSEGGGGGCFIATAAWGSDMQTEVRYLRAFRDHYLLNNRAGRWFVRQYYRYSPALANSLRQQPRVRALVRMALSPLVSLSRYLVSEEQLPQQSAMLSRGDASTN